MKKLFTLLIFCASLFAQPASADFWAGYNAYNEEDYATALQEFKPLAEEGDAIAQSYLGWMYLSGKGVPQDYKEAVKWLRLAAEQGEAEAQGNMGYMYEKGYGVLQDYQESVKWTRLSAEQGEAIAHYNLGVRYYNGEGVPQDYIFAHMWYNLAASNGHEKAAEYRDNTAQLMTIEQIGRAQDLARECLAKDYKGC